VHNFFARVNRYGTSAPASYGTVESTASIRVKRARVFFAFMSEVAISSMFLASRGNNRSNFQNAGMIRHGAAPANVARAR
jgi:hypothetical protein